MTIHCPFYTPESLKVCLRPTFLASVDFQTVISIPRLSKPTQLASLSTARRLRRCYTTRSSRSVYSPALTIHRLLFLRPPYRLQLSVDPPNTTATPHPRPSFVDTSSSSTLRKQPPHVTLSGVWSFGSTLS